MRFYLESADPAHMAAAARWPFVAGVISRVQLGLTGGPDDLSALLERACSLGRADWKLWVGLPHQSLDRPLEVAGAANERLAQLTGGSLAGPTLVFRLPPGNASLWAASRLLRDGLEVCLGPATDPLQGLASLWLPHVIVGENGQTETEGPPASRNPHAPHFVTADCASDAGATLLQLNDLLGATQARTRVLATGLNTRSRVDELLLALAHKRGSLVDLALPFDTLEELSSTS